MMYNRIFSSDWYGKGKLIRDSEQSHCTRNTLYQPAAEKMKDIKQHRLMTMDIPGDGNGQYSLKQRLEIHNVKNANVKRRVLCKD